MARTIGIGYQDFGQLIQNDYFYIDKTGFIKEWWETGDLFERLSIWQEEKYRLLQGTYKVLIG